MGCVGLLALSAPSVAATPNVAGPEPTALTPTFIVIDADTGAVIAAQDEHRAVPPASTVKLMAALVGLELLPLETTLQISPLVEAQPASKINMHVGEPWPLNDALHALLMASANDAAYAIAENAAGSLGGFAGAMARSGARMGLEDATFNDPAGLDAEGEGFRGGSLLSAFDLAIIARNALAVPEIAAASARLEDYPFTGPDGAQRTIPNHNDPWLSGYPGATGLKVGFTERANRTFVASATRNGRTCIAVVLGISDTLGWATRLADQCFALSVSDQGGLEVLPPVRVSTVDQRQAAVAGFPRSLGAGAVGVAVAGAEVTSDVPAAPSTSSPAAIEPDPTDSSTSTGSPETVPASSRSAAGSATGLVSARNAAVATMGVLATAFVLRRRQVSHQRRRRLAHQRMLADARRLGVLAVLPPDREPTEPEHVGAGDRPLRARSRAHSH